MRLRFIYLLLFFTCILVSRKSFAQGYICISTDPVNGQITLSFPNVGGAVDYYFLQWSLTSGTWNTMDSVMFAKPSVVTTYTIPGINGNNSRYYFRLVGQNTNNTGFEFESSNIFLNVTGIEKRIAKLECNADWVGSIGNHYIQRLDNGAWNTIYSIPNDVTHASYTYTDNLTNPPCDTAEIKYRILFERGSGVCPSISNIKSGWLTNRSPLIPDTIYITQVSIVNNNIVEVGCYYSPPNSIRQMLLERSDSPTGPFIPVNSLGSVIGDFLPQQIHLADPTARLTQQSYFYRATMVDSCNNFKKYSENISRTIFLSCSYPTNQSNLLEWNDYSDWYKGVAQYEIYRTLDGIPDPAAPLAIVTGTPFSYLDDHIPVSPAIRVCYYIRAVESPGNPVAVSAFSLSNLACAFREPVFLMPNAFKPLGTNNKFRPVQSYVDTNGFVMQIYNKWGQMIFETTDISAGWNGTIKGSMAPAGVYIYYARYKSFQGEEFDKRGTVVLLR